MQAIRELTVPIPSREVQDSLVSNIETHFSRLDAAVASLQRAKELEQQKRIETNNSRMLSEAVAPAVATKPPAAVVLAAALLFGACAGLGIAYLLEWLPSSRLLPQLPKPLTRLTQIFCSHALICTAVMPIASKVGKVPSPNASISEAPFNGSAVAIAATSTL